MLLKLGTIFRDGLRFELQKASAHKMASERTSIEDKQKKLEERLNCFNQKAQEIMGDNAEEGLDVLPPFTGWEESNEGVYGDDEEESSGNEEKASDRKEGEASDGKEDEASDGKEDEASDGKEDEASDRKEDEDKNSEKPETMPIWMPSSLNSEDIERLNLKILAA